MLVNKLVICLVLFCAFFKVARSQNYCSSTFCRDGITHIACNNSGTFADACPLNAVLYTFNQERRQLILKEHNSRRNRLAGGNVPGFNRAQRMATMRWNNELAKLAQLNVKKCIVERDKCHSTQKFKPSGQSLAKYSYSGNVKGITIESIISKIMNFWWSQNINANMTIIRQFPKNYTGPAIGRFTLMANEANTNAGCAAVRYRAAGWNNVLFTCNYAAANIANKTVYTPGQTAAKCVKGRNPKYTNLCALSEVYTNTTS